MLLYFQSSYLSFGEGKNADTDTESGDGRHNNVKRELSGVFHAISGANGRVKTGQIMDVGADGIVVPHLRTAAQLAEAVSFAKYPPEGTRGIGAERATRWGAGIEKCVPRANESSK